MYRMDSEERLVLNYLTRPWGFRKAVWLLVVIGGVVLSGRDIWYAIERYSRKPTNTVTRLQYPDEMSFPLLVLCNGNQFRITETQRDLYEVITDAYEHLDSRNEFNVAKYSRHFRAAVTNTKSDKAADYRKRVAHQAKDMILKCTTWEGKNCSANFTDEIYDYGVCFQFNGSMWPAITQPGSGQSLTMYLNLESYQHMQGPAQFLNSLKVTILDKGVFPYVTAKGFDIVPGYMSMIALKYKKYNRVLSNDGGACVEKRPLEHFEQRFYAADTCQLDLVFQKIQRNCNCKPYRTLVESLNNVTYCDIMQHFDCVMWQNYSVRNAASKCNQACSTIDYQVSVSQIKISPSIRSVLIDPDQEKSIRDTFNASQEAASRNDLKRVETLKTMIAALENASSILHALGMDPPTGENVSKDARKPFDHAVAVRCYTKIQENHKQILTEFKEKSLVGESCTFGAAKLDDAKITVQSNTNVLSCLDQIPNLWDYFYPRDNLAGNTSLNSTVQLYKAKVDEFVEFIANVASIYASPWCLSQPIGLKDYWKIGELIDLYNRRNITLKEWVDQQPTRIGGQYKITYANAFTNIYAVMRNRLDNAVSKSKNISDTYANQTRFWRFYGLYMGVCQKIYNKSLCGNITGSDGWTRANCTAPPFYSMEKFYADAIECASSDLAQNVSDYAERVEKAADEYESAAENLENFLLNYGGQWEFGDEFFSNNIVGLKVFFAELSQEIVTEEIAYDMSNLFGDIGGSIGLFIGASVLSMFEFLDILFFEMPFMRKLRAKCTSKTRAADPEAPESQTRAPTANSMMYGKRGLVVNTAHV